MAASFLDRLGSATPLTSVELRPPRADLEHGASMDSWMGMHAAIRRLVGRDTLVFLTDSAVGTREEENLHHLVTNLEEDVPRGKLCPFLTTKHTLEYCTWFAARAVEAGCGALTVLGGDTKVGAPRCVPHGYVLRRIIRERHPTLPLGGWINPHRDAARQVDLLLDPAFTADFWLTQVVSHHHALKVERFLEEAARRGVATPGVFGVFYYRSANPQTLARLAEFLPVPAAELIRDFGERGLDADGVCAHTIAALRRMGVARVYVSNLAPDQVAARLDAIGRRVEAILARERRP